MICPRPSGTAVLQSYRLCAVLTPAETQGLSALQGTLSGGEFTVKDEAFGTVSLKVRSTNSNIIFTGTAEQPEFTARIHVIAEVSAVTNTAKARRERSISGALRLPLPTALRNASPLISKTQTEPMPQVSAKSFSAPRQMCGVKWGKAAQKSSQKPKLPFTSLPKYSAWKRRIFRIFRATAALYSNRPPERIGKSLQIAHYIPSFFRIEHSMRHAGFCSLQI